MTQRDTLKCIHEPFGDAFYFGPERLGGRYEADEKARAESGFEKSTYQTILDRLEREGEEVCRLLLLLCSQLLVAFRAFDGAIGSFDTVRCLFHGPWIATAGRPSPHIILSSPMFLLSPAHSCIACLMAPLSRAFVVLDEA
jgi:hypothetical protein